MNVSLTTELEQLVKEKVASGMYHSASEVIREDVRSRQARAAHERLVRAALREGLLIHDVFERLGDEKAKKGC